MNYIITHLSTKLVHALNLFVILNGFAVYIITKKSIIYLKMVSFDSTFKHSKHLHVQLDTQITVNSQAVYIITETAIDVGIILK